MPKDETRRHTVKNLDCRGSALKISGAYKYRRRGRQPDSARRKERVRGMEQQFRDLVIDDDDKMDLSWIFTKK